MDREGVGGDRAICVTNIYALYAPGMTYFNHLTSWITKLKTYTHILGGDLNSMMDHREDRKKTKNPRYTTCDSDTTTRTSPMATFTDNIRVRDAWRLMSHLEREYTHFSHAHNSFLRIDYLLLTDNMIQKLKDVQIYEIAVSNHALVSVTLSLQAYPHKCNTWKFPRYLLENKDIKT